MAAKIGQESIAGGYIGTSSASAIYIGATLIWSADTTPVPTPTLKTLVVDDILEADGIDANVTNCLMYGVFVFSSIYDDFSQQEGHNYTIYPPFSGSYNSNIMTITGPFTTSSYTLECSAQFADECLSLSTSKSFTFSGVSASVSCDFSDIYTDEECECLNNGGEWDSENQECIMLDYSSMPMTFEVLSAGTIVYTAGDRFGTYEFEYNKNDAGWDSLSLNTSDRNHYYGTLNVEAGDKIQFRGDNMQYNDGMSWGHFEDSSTAVFKAYGNIMSLISSTDFSGMTELPYDDGSYYNTFYGFFQGTMIVDANNLILPATSLTNSCYCDMFKGCSGLTKAPDLPAATLTTGCYDGMFSNCTNLEYIKCLANNDVEGNTSNWVTGVAANGIFVKDANMSSWTTGANGIPSGWTVIDDSD